MKIYVINRIQKSAFFTGLFFLLVINVVFGQSPPYPQDSFRYAPANYRLIASGMILKGQKCDFNGQIENETKGIHYRMRVGSNVFYQGVLESLGEDGLTIQSLKLKTCNKYSMGELAESNGWYQRDKFNTPMIGKILGLHRTGNKLWMGTYGIGVVVYDLRSKTWARFDVKEKAIEGKTTKIYYGDNDYLFIRGTHENVTVPLIIYSVNKNKWVEVESIPRRAISEFGFTPERSRNSASLAVDDRIYDSKPFMPVRGSLSEVKSTIGDKGKTYIFERSYGDDSKTVFRLSKAEIRGFFN